MKVVAIIPARGNSVELPGKNIKNLLGRPLIAWTIQAALQSKTVDRVIVSTDSPEIAEIAKIWGAEVPFLRSPDLAKSDTPTSDTIIDALNQIGPAEYEIAVVLQPTSPLRNAADIDKLLSEMITKELPAMVSVKRMKENPFWAFRMIDGQLERLMETGNIATRRQDCESLFLPNGAIYAIRVKTFLLEKVFFPEGCAGFLMAAEKNVDIDTLEDFQSAESLLKLSNNDLGPNQEGVSA